MLNTINRFRRSLICSLVIAALVGAAATPSRSERLDSSRANLSAPRGRQDFSQSGRRQGPSLAGNPNRISQLKAASGETGARDYFPRNLTASVSSAASCPANPWTEQANVHASDGAPDDFFGTSVAISGDTAVVGGAAGAAYVFVRSGTVWSEQQKLTPAGTAFGFGESVAIDGDTIVVGAISDTVGSNPGQGSAFVFVRSGTIWSQQQRLVAADGESFDSFGNSVGISGNTVVVGSRFDKVGSNDAQGSAYVFTRSGAAWTQQQQIVASDGDLVDEFGSAVAIDGETIVVGAFVDDDAFLDQGSAYVFVRAGTSWSQQQKLVASDARANIFFGSAVGISGETIVVGAPFAGTPSTGEAYVFVRSGTVWTQQQLVTGNDLMFAQSFGTSVAISGERFVSGSVGAQIGGNVNQGALYVFERTGTSWTQQQKLVASGGAAGQFFGEAVAISGDVLLAGFFNEVVPMPVRGSVRIFARVCFDVCLQDDGNAGINLLFNSTTGDYLFCCGGSVFTGRGTISIRGSTATLTHNALDRRLSATFNGGGTNKGTASLQSPPGRILCTIRDTNTANNHCSCGV